MTPVPAAVCRSERPPAPPVPFPRLVLAPPAHGDSGLPHGGSVAVAAAAVTAGLLVAGFVAVGALVGRELGRAGS